MQLEIPESGMKFQALDQTFTSIEPKLCIISRDNNTLKDS